MCRRGRAPPRPPRPRPVPRGASRGRASPFPRGASLSRGASRSPRGRSSASRHVEGHGAAAAGHIGHRSLGQKLHLPPPRAPRRLCAAAAAQTAAQAATPGRGKGMGAHEEREMRHAVAPPQNLSLRRQQPPGKLRPKPPRAGRRRGHDHHMERGGRCGAGGRGRAGRTVSAEETKRPPPWEAVREARARQRAPTHSSEPKCPPSLHTCATTTRSVHSCARQPLSRAPAPAVARARRRGAAGGGEERE